jgi:hypothetical protein
MNRYRIKKIKDRYHVQERTWLFFWCTAHYSVLFLWCPPAEFATYAEAKKCMDDFNYQCQQDAEAKKK